MDFTLLIGSKSRGGSEGREYNLAGGFELGPYLKASISKTYALLLRAGVSYDAVIDDDYFDPAKLKPYLTLGLQWYF